jgi:hypothetical protein
MKIGYGSGAIEMSRHTTRTCPDTPNQKCPDNSNRKCPDTFACRDISYWATGNIPTAQQEIFRHFLHVGTFPVGQWEMSRQIKHCRDFFCWATGNIPTAKKARNECKNMMEHILLIFRH